MYSSFRTLLNDESGASALEYGIIVSLVSVAAIGAMAAVGVSVQSLLSSAGNFLEAARAGIDVGD